MKNLAEQKALEAYPKAPSPYYDDHILDRNVNCRVGYIKGYDQAMQDFLEKAYKYLAPINYTHPHLIDLDDFKNYMQDE